MTPLRIGIIGYGKMGQIRSAAVKATGRAQLVLVADDAYDGALPTGCRRATAQEILGSPDLDAVFICTPNYLNKPLTIQGLQSGKHVFCEKPPAFNAAAVEEIRATEAVSGLKLMYGFNHRHHESIKKMKSLIDSGASGKILWMRGRYGKSVDETFYQNWRSDRALAGGGILIDQGIHMLDLFLNLAGDFDEVKAFVSNVYWHLDIEDNVFAILRNSTTNIVASLHSTMTQWRHLFSLEVFCERGYYVLNGLLTSSRAYGDEVLSISKSRTTAPMAVSVEDEQIVYPADESWQSEVDHFFDAIEHDRSIDVGNSAEALKLMKLVDRIYAER
jgi:predicted dehydrogenase